MTKRKLTHAECSKRTLRRLEKRRKSREQQLDDTELQTSDEEVEDDVLNGTSLKLAVSDDADHEVENSSVGDNESAPDVDCDERNQDQNPEKQASSSSDEGDESDVPRSDLESDIPDTESDDDSTDHRNYDYCGNEALFPNSDISVAESAISILQFYLRHNLSNAALADLLQLITHHCPSPNQCIKSLYFFRKFLGDSEVPIVKHFYCSECFQKLDTSTTKCSNTECADAEISYFIEIPIECQLQEFFKRPGFYNNLNYRFERTKEAAQNLEDIYDGNVYKKYYSSTNQFDLTSQSNISFMWNSDGVPLYQSSKISIWPFFLKINELPPSERNKPPNMIVAALWFGSKKPDANLFMSPLINVTKKLYNGIPFEIHDLQKTSIIRAMTICGTCDLPAKAQFLNMHQYNGTYGCHKCLIETECIERKRSYSCTDEVESRTLANTLDSAEIAMERGKPHLGVKGPTVLRILVEDYVRYTTLDAMHMLTGISKRLLEIWTTSEYRHHEASLAKHKKIINKRLDSIRPPSFLERTPRNISVCKYWKASEHIQWLLVYSPVVLNGIMTDKIFEHHMKLVYGVYLLYQDSIPPDDVNKAAQLLDLYLTEFKHLYGSEFMSCNLHSLKHLSSLVADYGPLRIFTCFPFENGNGRLKSLLHATRDAQLQVCSGVSWYLRLATFKAKYLKEERISAFCHQMESKSKRRCKILATTNGISIIDRPKKFINVPPAIREALQQTGIVGDSVYEFKRLLKNGKIYSSQSYTRTRKTDSTCVEFVENGTSNLGLAKCFLRVSNCSCADSLCNTCRDTTETLLIYINYQSSNPFCITEPETTVGHIYELRDDGDELLRVITAAQLQRIYCIMKVSNDQPMYAVRPITL